jgi:hypothetical protein
MRYRLAATEGDFREKDLTGANIAVTLYADADVVLAIPPSSPGRSARSRSPRRSRSSSSVRTAP